MRLLMNAPYPAMAAALLLAHRNEPDQVEVAERRGTWVVRRRRRVLGPMLQVLDGFAISRGWLPSRRHSGGLGAADLLSILDSVGIASLVGPRAVLAESFFAQLRAEAEEMELHTHLQPLVEALSEWLQEAPEPEDR